MANQSLVVNKSLSWLPLSTAPSNPVLNEIYNDSILGLLIWNGTSWTKLINQDYIHRESDGYLYSTVLNNFVWAQLVGNAVVLSEGVWELQGGLDTLSGVSHFSTVGWFTANGDDTTTDPGFSLDSGNALLARTSTIGSPYSGPTHSNYLAVGGTDTTSTIAPVIRLEIVTPQIIYLNARSEANSITNVNQRVNIYAKKIG